MRKKNDSESGGPLPPDTDSVMNKYREQIIECSNNIIGGSRTMGKVQVPFSSLTQ
jgi:hypothetical protein